MAVLGKFYNNYNAENQFLVFFLSGRLRQGLLYLICLTGILSIICWYGKTVII